MKLSPRVQSRGLSRKLPWNKGLPESFRDARPDMVYHLWKFVIISTATTIVLTAGLGALLFPKDRFGQKELPDQIANCQGQSDID